MDYGDLEVDESGTIYEFSLSNIVTLERVALYTSQTGFREARITMPGKVMSFFLKMLNLQKAVLRLS